MSVNMLLVKIAALVLIPPASLIILGAAGLVISLRRPGLGKTIIALSLALLYAASAPVFANRLIGYLEEAGGPPTVISKTGKAGAIVVIGAGRNANAPEYGGDTLNMFALERVRYAAYLARKTGLPILASGGSPRGGEVSEARLMKTALEEDFHVPVRWMEEKSRNTFENAVMSRAMLEGEGINTVYLVTHAWHMARARMVFEQAGFDVIPAPTGFSTREKVSVFSYIPSGKSMLDTSLAVKEMLGIVWYSLK